MRKSRKFIKEHKLKTIANMDREERREIERKRSKVAREIGRNWNQVHNKEEDRGREKKNQRETIQTYWKEPPQIKNRTISVQKGNIFLPFMVEQK